MEKVYHFGRSADRLIEKLIDDDVAMINHIILNKGDALPPHDSNSNVYLMVIGGVVTLKLADNPAVEHENGTIINIPAGVGMNISNQRDQQLEFFVVKAPSPRLFQR